jgi:sugar phosphate permease
MVGINMMLVSFVPAHFSRRRLTAFFSGLANSMVYAGSSLSSFIIALMIGKFGWNPLILVFAALAFFSALLCLLSAPRRRQFLRQGIFAGTGD